MPGFMLFTDNKEHGLLAAALLMYSFEFVRGGRDGFFPNANNADSNCGLLLLAALLVVASALFTWSTRFRIIAMVVCLLAAVALALDLAGLLPFGILRSLAAIRGAQRALVDVVAPLLIMSWAATRFARDIRQLRQEGLSDLPA